MTQSLYLKYRPTTFEEVIGQRVVVKSLKSVLEKRSNHSFLLTGPSGCGKTTLARIAATQLGVTSPQQIREFDAATYTGIDDVRGITELLMYKPIGVKPLKVIIIDECHALSAPAWKALLKTLEEPPEWVYFFLCTTDPTRVPITNKTRCSTYTLSVVDKEVIFEWLCVIARKEKILGDDEGEKIIYACAKEAGGSPRQALVNLASCTDLTSVKDARSLMRSADGAPEAIALARLLDKGGTWQQAQQLLDALKDTNPESVRQVVRAYMTKAALGAETEKAWAHRLKILHAFSDPCNSADGITPMLLATARSLFT